MLLVLTSSWWRGQRNRKGRGGSASQAFPGASWELSWGCSLWGLGQDRARGSGTAPAAPPVSRVSGVRACAQTSTCHPLTVRGPRCVHSRVYEGRATPTGRVPAAAQGTGAAGPGCRRPSAPGQPPGAPAARGCSSVLAPPFPGAEHRLLQRVLSTGSHRRPGLGGPQPLSRQPVRGPLLLPPPPGAWGWRPGSGRAPLRDRRGKAPLPSPLPPILNPCLGSDSPHCAPVSSGGLTESAPAPGRPGQRLGLGCCRPALRPGRAA